MVNQENVFRDCMPFDKFGRNKPIAEFAQNCSRLSSQALEWRESVFLTAWYDQTYEEPISTTERIHLLDTVKVARKEAVALLGTVEAKALYAVGGASLIAGIVVLLLVGSAQALLVATPFFITLMLFLPLLVVLLRTRSM